MEAVKVQRYRKDQNVLRGPTRFRGVLWDSSGAGKTIAREGDTLHQFKKGVRVRRRACGESWACGGRPLVRGIDRSFLLYIGVRQRQYWSVTLKRFKRCLSDTTF